MRASWAEVGNDTSPYQMSLNYALYPHPVGGVSSGQISNSTVPNRDLKPTRTRSWEVGTELYFLNKRIVLDFTYYSQTSRDQIRHVNTSISTGYSTALLNSGVLTNKGIEIKLNTIPVKTKNWQWDLGFNFARNSNKVHSLGESQMYEVENAEWVGAAGVRVMAVVGEELGTIMGKDYKRNENGDIIVDPTTGIPSVSDNYTALGNAHWKFTGGMYTNVRFKNWNLSAIFDIKVGADLYTSTMRGTYSSGRSKKTLKGRDGWYQSEEGRLAAGLETAAWNPTGGYLVDGVVQVKNDDGTDQLGAQYPLLQPGKLLELHLQQHSPVLRAGQLLRQDPRNDAQLQLPAEDDRKGAGRTDPVVRSPKPADHLQERSEHRPRLQLQQRQRKRNRVRLAALAPQFRIQH